MSVLTKYFSILMLGGIGFFALNSFALTSTNTDELYSIEYERSSAEVPSSIDTSALTNNDGEEYVVDSTPETMEEVEALKKPTKKISSPSVKKKSSKN